MLILYMNNGLLLLNEKPTDTLIEQTKTKPQETLEFIMDKQRQNFSFNPPINLVEEGKWLLAVTFFDCTNSVFNITNGNNSFSITIPDHWENNSAEKIINQLNKLLELRSQNGIDLHVEQVKKGLILVDDYSLSSLGTFKEEILKELKEGKYDDVEDLVYRFQLTNDEIINIFDLKYTPTKRIGYSLKPNIYQMSKINKTLKFILSDNVKIVVTIDDKKLKSNLKLNQTLIFNKRSFLYNIWIHSILFRTLR